MNITSNSVSLLTPVEKQKDRLTPESSLSSARLATDMQPVGRGHKVTVSHCQGHQRNMLETIVL